MTPEKPSEAFLAAMAEAAAEIAPAIMGAILGGLKRHGADPNNDVILAWSLSLVMLELEKQTPGFIALFCDTISAVAPRGET